MLIYLIVSNSEYLVIHIKILYFADNQYIDKI